VLVLVTVQAGTAPRALAQAVAEDDSWTGGFEFGVEVFDLVTAPDGIVYGAQQASENGPEGQVVRWDGESWSILGAVFPTAVYDLAVTTDGTVVAAVQFAGVFVWSGSEWIPLNSRQAPIEVISDGDGGLYANFSAGTERWYVSHWNGDGWTDLGGLILFPVYKMVLGLDGSLIVAGRDSTVFQSRAFVWNGSNWSQMGEPFNVIIRELILDPAGRPLISGRRNQGTAEPQTGPIIWDGTKWIRFEPDRLADDSEIYSIDECGDFIVSTLAGIGRFDGVSVTDFGTGLSGRISSVVLAGRDLVVGGALVEVGGISTSGVGIWRDKQYAISQTSLVSEIPGACDYEQQTHGAVLRLYRAFFDRDPDVAGAKYWIDINEQSQTLDQIADYFTLSNEFGRNYDDTTNEQYLQAVYANILSRDYDQAGFDYWLELLDSAALTRGGVVRWIATNPEFIARYPYNVD
jgi:hypothetical protein